MLLPVIKLLLVLHDPASHGSALELSVLSASEAEADFFLRPN